MIAEGRTGSFAAAAVLAGLALLSSASLHSQSQPARRAVRLRTLGPGGNMYVLLDGGGNSLVMSRPDNAVLIDGKSAGWGRAILDAVDALTDKPVTIIINTSGDPEHVGGNVEITTATQIVAHQNAKAAMEKLDAFKGAGAKFLPNKIVTDRLSLLEDTPDRIDLYYFGPAHTNGDLAVVFPAKRIAYLGDLFPSKGVPAIDVANGGSAVAFAQTVARAAAEISGVRTVITGHPEGVDTQRSASAVSTDISTPRTMTWTDFQEFAEFSRDLLAVVRESFTAGKTAAETAAALKLPAKYAAYDLTQARAYVDAVYKELGSPR